MNHQLYDRFIRHCVQQSSGWLPMRPLSQNIKVGDFGQFNQGQFLALGNIADLALIEHVVLAQNIPLAHYWCWSQGVLSQYQGSSSSSGEDNFNHDSTSWHQRVYGFDNPGSFAFVGRSPEADLMLEWSKLAPEITLRLTQSLFNFRQVSVITGVACVPNWALAIAANSGAQLQLASHIHHDWFGMNDSSAKLMQSAELACAHLAQDEKAFFFKAKKLVLTAQKHDQLLVKMLEQLPPEQVGHWLSAGLINRLPDHELNLNTCLDTFDWADVVATDIQS